MNKLGRYLETHGIARSVFAARVGASASAITALCKDPPGYWPSSGVALRIREATGGLVTPNDFLPPYVTRPAGDMPGEAGDREGEDLATPAADLCPTIGERA